MFFFLSSSSIWPEREVAYNALALGVLRHFIGDGHGDQPREHPTGLAARRANQAPAIGARARAFEAGSAPRRRPPRRARSWKVPASLPAAAAASASAAGEPWPISWAPFRRSFGLLRCRRDQRLPRCLGARQHDGLQYIEFLALLELQKTGRRNHRLRVNVERSVGGGDSLRRQLGGVRGQLAQRVHVPRGEQLTLVGPSLDPPRGTHSQETAADLENLQAVAMLHSRNRGRLKRNVASNLQYGGTNERFTHRLRARRPFRTAGEQQQNGCQAYLCYGT